MEILTKVAALKADLDSLRPINADREAAIVQKLRLDWNFHSNHLEGNSLTYGETKALILFGITAAGKPLKDHFEMTGHDEAIKWVEEVVRETRPLTENFIRQLHQLILKEPYEVDAITPDGKPARKKISIGAYKTTANHVLTPTGEIFRFATPEETPAKMADLIEWYRQKKDDPETHPLLLAAEFHYKFIRIHPFDDGNGRTARILMNFILMQNGYPPVIVRSEDKQNYIAALRQADVGTITPFIEYIGKNLERSLEIMIRGAKGENIDEADDVDKEVALLHLKLKRHGATKNIQKSNEILFEIFDELISKLIVEFFEQCEKFNQFYFKGYMKVRGWKGESPKYKKISEEVLKEIRTNEFINAKSTFKLSGVSIFWLIYEYNKFNAKGIPEFDYKSEIKIEFDVYKYSILPFKGNLKYDLYYDEILSEDDIRKLVRSEIKAHNEFINHQIELTKS